MLTTITDADITMTPSIQEVSSTIKNLIYKTLEDVKKSGHNQIVTSHIENSTNDDSWSMSISFALAETQMDDKTLNFTMVQNIKTRDISIIITTGEKEGLRILYKTITKYPIAGLEKYLPNIVTSSISILTKNGV